MPEEMFGLTNIVETYTYAIQYVNFKVIIHTFLYESRTEQWGYKLLNL